MYFVQRVMYDHIKVGSARIRQQVTYMLFKHMHVSVCRCFGKR